MKRMTSSRRHLLLTLALSAFSLLLAVFRPTADRILCFFAMLLSTLGDLALMDFRCFFSKRKWNGFLCGGVFFLLSHVVYASAYVSLRRAASLPPSRVGIVAALLTGIAAYLSLLCMSKRNHCFGWKKAALLFLYSAFIVLDMAAVFAAVFALSAQGSAWRLIGALGILSFLVSDYFIGMDKVASDPSLTRLIWVFYPIGQLLLLLAA